MIHYTIEGNKILIADMLDEHLLNTIKLLCKNIITLSNKINSKNLTGINAALYQVTEYDIETIRDKIIEYSERLNGYITEAVIRGLEVRNILVKTFERDKKLGTNIELDNITF